MFLIAGTISPTIEGLRITGGDATGLGGANSLDAGGGVYAIAATVTMSESQVLSNTAGLTTSHDGFGGGLFFLNSSNTVLQDNDISLNTAFQGGGLYCSTCPSVLLSNNTISDNVANRLGKGMKHFGGMRFAGCDGATLIGNTISGNEAANDCAGVCFDDSDNVVLIGNVIVDNLRFGGFRGYGIGMLIRNSQNASLVGNVIRNNTSKLVSDPGTILGGGLFVLSSNVSLTSNRIVSNGATRGGGLYAGSNSSLALASNIITGNIVYDDSGHSDYDPVGYGGGLYLNNSAATMTNTIVADNQTDTIGHGSGLYIYNSSLHSRHATVADNYGADGSGVYITGTNNTVVLTNTIIASHTVGVTATAGNSVVLDGVLWWDNQANTGGDGEITITEEYTGDPAFVDTELRGYRIGPGSAAVDLEMEYTEVGVPEDIDGEPRPMGWGSDYGADELLIRLAVTKQANPNPVQAGAQLTYTLRVTNTGFMGLHATITDVLPAHVTPSGILTWAPVITASGDVWEQVVVVTVDPCYGRLLNNLLQVTTEEGVTGTATHTVTVLQSSTCIYLPLVLKNH